MQKCPHCKSPVQRGKKEQARAVAGTTFVVTLPALSCRACSALFVLGEVLQRADIAIAVVIAKKGTVNGETLRFMRKALGLRGFALAELLGITGETVSRWETGQRAVDPRVWVLVGSLVMERAGVDPETMKRLLSLDRRSKLPKTMRLALPDSAGFREVKALARTRTVA